MKFYTLVISLLATLPERYLDFCGARISKTSPSPNSGVSVGQHRREPELAPLQQLLREHAPLLRGRVGCHPQPRGGVPAPPARPLRAQGRPLDGQLIRRRHHVLKEEEGPYIFIPLHLWGISTNTELFSHRYSCVITPTSTVMYTGNVLFCRTFQGEIVVTSSNETPALPCPPSHHSLQVLASSFLAPIIFNSYEISGFTEHPQTLFDECQAARKRD